MWKELLPINCPPPTAKEVKRPVYRILREIEPTTDDFVTYANLYKDNPRYQKLCEAHAISFYDSFANAKLAWEDAYKRGKNLGNFIGEFTVEESHGCLHYNPKNGHCNVWLYNTWNFEDFLLTNIIEINGN